MSLLFGNLTQDFIEFQGVAAYAQDPNNATAQAQLPIAQASFRHTAALDASYLVYIGQLVPPIAEVACAHFYPDIGLGMFVCTFIYMYIWVYTGEVNAKRLRENYLQAVLRQDIAYFDNVGAGEVTTRIQTDTREFPHDSLTI